MSFLFQGGHPNVAQALIRLGVDTGGMQSQVRKAVAQMRHELQAGTRGLGSVNTGAAQLEQASHKVSRSAMLLKGAAVGLGAGLAGVIAMSVRAASQWESAFAGVRKTMSDATEGELKALEGQIRQMSLEMPMAATQLARIGEAAGALGIKSKDVAGFVKTVAMIGTTTNVSTDAAATALGQLTNVLDMTVSDYPKFAAALVDLGNKGASTESQIIEIANRAGGAAAMIKMSVPSLLAFASATANLGIEVEAGGTSLQRLFLDLGQLANAEDIISSTAAKAGKSTADFISEVEKGGKHVSTLAKGLGVTTQTLSKMVTSRSGLGRLAEIAGMSTREFKRLFDLQPDIAILRIMQAMSQMTNADRMATIAAFGWAKEVRLNRLVMGLTQKDASNLANSLMYGKNAWEAQTAAVDEAAERYKTTSSQMGLLKNNLTDLMITFGSTLLPSVVEVTRWLTVNIPQAIKDMSGVWQRYLEEPLTEAWRAAVKVGEALGDIFLNWGGEGGGQTNALLNALSGVARMVAVLASYVTHLLDAFNGLLRLPLVNELGKIAIAFAALLAVTRTMGFVARGVRGAVAGIGSALNPRNMYARMTGQAIAATGEEAAVIGAEEKAAATLTSAAEMQMGAARELMAAAQALMGGRLGGGMLGGGTRAMAAETGLLYGGGGAIAPLAAGSVASQQMNAAFKAAPWQKMGGEWRTIGGQIVGGVTTEVTQGLTSGLSRMRSAGSFVAAGASGAIGALGKLFWPLVIADLVGSLVSPMIGDALAKDPRMQRVAAQFQKGYMDGITSLMSATWLGTDAFEGRAASYKVGGLDLTTKGIAGQVSRSQNAEQYRALLDAADAAQTDLEKLAALRDLGRTFLADVQASEVGKRYMGPESYDLPKFEGPDKWGAFKEQLQWWGITAVQLGELSQEDWSWLNSVDITSQDMDWDRFNKVIEAFGGRLKNLRGAVAEADRLWRASVTDLLAGQGFDRQSLFQLSPEQMQRLADIYSKGTVGGGTTPYAQRYLAGKVIAGGNLSAPSVIKPEMTAEQRNKAWRASLEAGADDLAGIDAANLENDAALKAADETTFNAANAFVDDYYDRVKAAVAMKGKSPKTKAIRQALIDEIVPKAEQTGDLQADWQWVLKATTEMITLAGRQGENDYADAIAQMVEDGTKTGLDLVDATKVVDDAIGLRRDLADALSANLSGIFGDAIAEASTLTGDKGRAARSALLEHINNLLPDELDFKDWKALQNATQSDAALAAYFRKKLQASLEAGTAGVTWEMPQDPPAELIKQRGEEAAREWWQEFRADVQAREGPLPKDPPKDLIQAVGKRAAQRIWKGIRDDWQNHRLPKPKPPTDSTLTTEGTGITGQIAEGMTSGSAQELISNAAQVVLGWIKGFLPGSPVKRGPMKHPYLPNAGRGIIQQIAAGMSSTALTLPAVRWAMPQVAGLSGGGLMPTVALAGAGAGAGRTQNIYVDSMTLLGPADEDSVAEQLAFMDGGG